MDSKRPCNEVIQTPKDLVVYLLTYSAYVFLKTFIEAILTFRDLWFGAHFVYCVRECSNSILTFFVLISLPPPFIVSLANVYRQPQAPFLQAFSISCCLLSFWQWPYWVLWGHSFLWFWFAFLIFSEIDLFSYAFFSRVSSCYLFWWPLSGHLLRLAVFASGWAMGDPRGLPPPSPSKSRQPSHPLLSPSPPAFNLSQHQGLFQWVSSLHQVANILEFQLQHQSFQWMFRTDFL